MFKNLIIFFFSFWTTLYAHDGHQTKLLLRYDQSGDLKLEVKFELDEETVKSLADQVQAVETIQKQYEQNLIISCDNKKATWHFDKYSTEKFYFVTLDYHLMFDQSTACQSTFKIQSKIEGQIFWVNYFDEKGAEQVVGVDFYRVADALTLQAQGEQNSTIYNKITIFSKYVILGIEHIIPKGLDHILFILGLYLLSIKFSALVWQVSAFTIAHGITLALTMLGYISLPSKVVEVLIALSIVLVGIENIFTSKLHPWRTVVVFLFGLFHGMGFAGVLSELGPSKNNFLSALLGFNLGVEFGQIIVILIAFLIIGTWASKKTYYHKFIVIPLSSFIALMGLYWAYERLTQ